MNPQQNPEQSLRLDGLRAVVTGGASGIGNAIARTFYGAGASVVLLDLNAEAALSAAEAIGPDVTAISCDVSNEQSVAQAFSLVAQQGSSQHSRQLRWNRTHWHRSHDPT